MFSFFKHKIPKFPVGLFIILPIIFHSAPVFGAPKADRPKVAVKTGNQASPTVELGLGDVLDAQVFTDWNIKKSELVAATITTGPFKGCHLTGRFNTDIYDRLIIVFNRLVLPNGDELNHIQGLAILPGIIQNKVAPNLNAEYLKNWGENLAYQFTRKYNRPDKGIPAGQALQVLITDLQSFDNLDPLSPDI